MRLVFSLIIAFSCLTMYGQKTGVYYFSPLGELCNVKNAKQKNVISIVDDNIFKEENYFKVGKKWSKRNTYNTYEFRSDTEILMKLYLNNDSPVVAKRICKKIADSLLLFTDYNEDSVVLQSGEAVCILPLIYNGLVKNYFNNGNLSIESKYRNNRLISNQRWRYNGEKDLENVFESEQIEVEPKFNDGSLNKFIAENIVYPEEARRESVVGRVVVQFIIMEDGSVQSVKIVKNLHPKIDEEAIRVVKLTNGKWIPGSIENNPVRVIFNIPILYSLN